MIDLKGVRVGDERVVSVAGSDPHYGRIWLLRCKCGATRTQPALRIRAAIKRGTSSGCPSCRASRSRAAVARVFADLFQFLAVAATVNAQPKPQPTRRRQANAFRPGLRIGSWRLLRAAEGEVTSTNGRRYGLWVCRCDCGAEATKNANVLSVMACNARKGGVVRCMACHKASRARPANQCNWCGRPIREADQKIRECNACARRALRNGRGPKGNPLYVLPAKRRPQSVAS